jgi:hypothetical protein
LADTKILVRKFMPRMYRMGSEGMIAVEGEDVELNAIEGKESQREATVLLLNHLFNILLCLIYIGKQ